MNEYTYIAIEVDEEFSYSTMDDIFTRERDYIMNQLVDCAKYMIDSKCYDEQTYFQLIWKNTNTDFALCDYNIVESLNSTLAYFESMENYERCVEIRDLLCKI